jgi:hypothetical protein
MSVPGASSSLPAGDAEPDDLLLLDRALAALTVCVVHDLALLQALGLRVVEPGRPGIAPERVARIRGSLAALTSLRNRLRSHHAAIAQGLPVVAQFGADDGSADSP